VGEKLTFAMTADMSQMQIVRSSTTCNVSIALRPGRFLHSPGGLFLQI
jgi:hypothetical protein